MSFAAFLGFLAVGAALLAGWLAARFAERSPNAAGRAVLHFGIALILVWAAPNLVEPLAGAGPQAVIAVLFFLLPALTYACLAAFWILTIFHQAVGR
jgi:hypothetical protein